MEENIVVKILGFIVVIKLLLSVLYYIQLGMRILINKTIPQNYPHKYGKWAVVTGCTDGIGLAYSRELARRGFSVVLISRSEDKLKAVATDIESDYNVETKIIVVDFSHGRHVYEKIANEIKNVDIGILVNNVGCALPYVCHMETSSDQQIWDLVTCNVLAGTMMAKLVLPGMKCRKRGAIINISSLSGLAPWPYYAIYGATKRYIEALSAAIRCECRNKNVTVQSLYPGLVKTKIVPEYVTPPDITYPNTDTYVRNAFLTLGVTDSTAGYFTHELQAISIKLCPPWLFNLASAMIYKAYRQ